jgi:MraZ protein
MSQFLGTHQNRLDAKGRVSVPAVFRAALKNLENSSGLILRPSHKHSCIEAWPGGIFSALARPLEALDLFSEAHDDMAAVLYADAYPIDTDKDGRILLPDSLVSHAGLIDTVVFIGMGRIFQIWEPKAAEIFREGARERARARGLTLPGVAA